MPAKYGQEQPIGLALFAVSATFAPAIGPTIGGYLTKNGGWQCIFYVNCVPGTIMIGMLWFSRRKARSPGAPEHSAGGRFPWVKTKNNN